MSNAVWIWRWGWNPRKAHRLRRRQEQRANNVRGVSYGRKQLLHNGGKP